MTTFYTNRESNMIGVRLSDCTASFLQHLHTYLLDNEEQCQFSLKEIMSTYTDDIPEIRTIKRHLQGRYGDDVYFYSVKNDVIINFRSMTDKIVCEQSNECRIPQDPEERSKIIKIAANIILEDTRVKYYDNSAYRAPCAILDNVKEDVPPSLQLFLDTLIENNKRLNNRAAKLKWERRVTTIAPVIISSVRPRSFLSSILLGLLSMMHKKHASKRIS